MENTSSLLELPPAGFLASCFRFIVAKRWWIIGFYALLMLPSAYFALRVNHDNSLERLIIKSDQDYLNMKAFEKVFGSNEFTAVVLRNSNLWTPEFLLSAYQLETNLSSLQNVSVDSLLSRFSQINGGFTAEDIPLLRQQAQGTTLNQDQGLLGPDSLVLQVSLQIKNASERHIVLEKIEKILTKFQQKFPPGTRVIKLGQPYINAYLDQSTHAASYHYFPLFTLFVLLLNWLLYRSLRSMLAFIFPLLASAALSMGYIGLTGGDFTIVSSLVPMTVLIICTATLVYIHSRFVQRPSERSVADHQIFALTNKFLACTASIFATAVGFMALAVSKIRPIREMGIWVGVGLIFTWLVVFTLFPALQSLLKTPTQQEQKATGRWFLKFTKWLPLFTYRFRFLLVGIALLWCAIGAIAIVGIPGTRFTRMRLQTSALEYLNRKTDLYRDTKAVQDSGQGLSITHLWLAPVPHASVDILKPDVLTGLNQLEQQLKTLPNVTSVIGLPTVVRTYQYFAKHQGDQFPQDSKRLQQLAQDLRSPLLSNRISSIVDTNNFNQTNLVLRSQDLDYEGFVALKSQIQTLFTQVQGQYPALKNLDLQMVGISALQAKITHNLIPTLVDSFGLTVLIIFITFLLVFRNGPARIMALIPSVFAILAMFSLMRLFGLSLNVATILIASTVLGTSENDQIHFFYHYQEKRKTGSTEQALRHTLLVAGRAIIFATLINAAGFLAFGIADLPPIREFGLLSGAALLLSMIADFTALPAALWIVFRDKPDSLKTSQP